MRVVVVVIECLCTGAPIQTVHKCMEYIQQIHKSQVIVAYLSDRNSPMKIHPIEPLRKEPMGDIVNIRVDNEGCGRAL